MLKHGGFHPCYQQFILYRQTLIRIFVKYSDCSDPENGIYPEYLLFKVENVTASEVHAYWEWSFAYDGRTMSKNDTDEELVKISGIEDAVFCHKGQFLFVSKSKEGAMAAAHKAL